LLPHKKAWSTTEETETYNGCYTKTVYLNGRAYTYTTCYCVGSGGRPPERH